MFPLTPLLSWALIALLIIIVVTAVGSAWARENKLVSPSAGASPLESKPESRPAVAVSVPASVEPYDWAKQGL